MAIASGKARVALAEVRLKQVAEAEPPSGLGALLRQARERLGVSLDRISSETKIPKRHLEALEDDNLSVAPGGIYLRAEVRAFARAVHLDENLALTRLERLLNPPAAPRETLAEARPPEADRPAAALTPIQPWAGLAVLALAALVATLLGWPAGPAATPVATPVVSRDATPAASQTDLPPPVSPRAAPPASAPAALVETSRPTVQPRAALPAKSARAADDAETPAPNGTFTELVIATQPPGARVTVNGINWGTSPVTIRHLSPGAKRIRVSLDGYVSAERSFTLSGGRPLRIEVPLRPK